MKKIGLLFLLVILSIFIISCNGNDETKINPEVISLEKSEYSLKVNETISLNVIFSPENTTEKDVEWVSGDNTIATVVNGQVTGVKKGETTISVISKVNSSVKAAASIIVLEDSTAEVPVEKITISGNNTVELSKNISLTVKVYPENAKYSNIIFSSSDEKIATVDNKGVVTGTGIGKCNIIATVEGTTISEKYEIEVFQNVVSITHNIPSELVERQSVEFVINMLPENAKNKDYVIVSKNKDIVMIEQNKLIAVAEGVCEITISLLDGTLTEKVIITVKKDEAPQIIIDEEKTTLDVNVNYNTEFDPLWGIKAIDDVDGDITSKMTIEGKVNNRLLGTTKLRYKVVDSAGHITKLERQINVIWDYAVTFIGHGGCYSGIMNSEEAFINALTVHGYQAIECDLKQTKDGVFVLCHDDSFNGISLASATYEELKNVEYTTTRGGISYTTKLCTLAKYLQICKTYNAYAVIELKSSSGITNSDQSRMGALMDEIKKGGMLDKVIFLGSQYNCLIWTRNNGYENIPCQYLVNSCESETYLQRCIDYKLDISLNVDDSYSNSDAWIARYKEAGCKVAGYTFSQYTDAAFLQKWINKGLDYVTVDVTKPYQVELPIKVVESGNKFNVTFKDFDGSVIKVSEVFEGKTAVTPVDPKRNGYKFIGWDKEITNIKSDLEVNALYEIETYSIKYDANSVVGTEVAFKDKEEFLNEFYTDWFNWLDSQVGKINGLTKTGNTYTFAVNGKKPTWTDVTSLRNLDIYDVECTIGYYVYKPITRSNNEAYEHQEAEGYFLNTNPYRIKWKAMDSYLLNVLNTAYTSYDKGYNAASNGRVQIFFRFHQWNKGTKIPSFDTLPTKYVVESSSNILDIVLPTSPVSYTILDTINLDNVKATSSNFKFSGWFLDSNCTNPINEIKNLSTNLVLYAKWVK